MKFENDQRPPTRITASEGSEEHIATGRKMLKSCKDVQNKGTRPLWSSSLTTKLPDGGAITAQVLHGQNGKVLHQLIDIITGSVERRKHREMKCKCTCNFSIGTVVSAEPSENELYQIYTVSVCHGGDRYSLYENILGTDFTPWEEGMGVIVIAYNEFLYDCCALNFDATGCVPVESEEELFTAEWFPTYRIAPFCRFVAKWTEKYV